MVIGGNLERWLKKRWLKRREQERLDRAVAGARLEARTSARAEIQGKWAAEQERLDRAVAAARSEAHTEARSQALAEVQRKWAEWNQRRLDAEARGEPFTDRTATGCTAAGSLVRRRRRGVTKRTSTGQPLSP
jgi:hypothetical protein